MSRVVASLIAIGCASVPVSSAYSAELVYQWKKGDLHRFEAKSDDTIKMSGMGISMDSRFHTESTFVLEIDRVKPGGVAEGTLFIEAFSIKDDSGRMLANLDGLPKSALKNAVEVDKKGAFIFKEVVYLLVDDEGQNLLVSMTGSPTGSSATAQHDGQEVTLWASFDPKTGQLSGGASIKEIGKKQKKVKVSQEKAKVDVLPKMFMELMRLPDGQVAGGDTKIAMKHPNLSSETKMIAQILEDTQERVKIKTTFASANESRTPTAEDDGEGDDESAEEGDPTGGMMGGIPGLSGIPGMGGGSGGKGGKGGQGGGSITMGVNVSGDATIEMNPAKGVLERLAGTLATKTNLGGMMSVESTSKLVLVRKK